MTQTAAENYYYRPGRGSTMSIVTILSTTLLLSVQGTL